MSQTLIPPNNLEAERSVIGSILIDQDSILKVMEFLTAADFYQPKHRDIFETIEELYYAHEPVDILTLTSKLKIKKKLSPVGGAAYLSELANTVPTSAHAENYAKLVKETSTRRKLIHHGSEVTKLAQDESLEMEKVLNESEKGIFEISESNIKQDFQHISVLLEETYEKAAELAENKDLVRGIPSGFSGLDNILGGFQNSDLIIIATRPSVGKSALILDFALNAGVNAGKNVGIFSLEMSNLQNVDRMLAMQSGVGLWDLRMGNLKDKSFEKLADAMGMLSEANIFIDDTPGLSINEMRTKCRRLKMEKGLDMVIVDYLQLVTATTTESRVQEVSEISRFLKILAKELNVPVIAAAQLSRAIEQRTDRRPQLSDLRESGSIEQDADIVMFLQREEVFNPDTEKKGIAELIISKHRNGPTGVVELFFHREQARYRQLEKNISY